MFDDFTFIAFAAGVFVGAVIALALMALAAIAKDDGRNDNA